MRERIERRLGAGVPAWLYRIGAGIRTRGPGKAAGCARIPSWVPVALCLVVLCMALTTTRSRGDGDGDGHGGGPKGESFDIHIQKNENQMIADGRRIFRFDTFGDEAFWGGVLMIQEFVATVSPRAALSVGLKVDVDALTSSQVQAIQRGRLDLDDPAVTLALLKQNAVVGVTGIFQPGTMSLQSFGIRLMGRN